MLKYILYEYRVAEINILYGYRNAKMFCMSTEMMDLMNSYAYNYVRTFADFIKIAHAHYIIP